MWPSRYPRMKNEKSVALVVTLMKEWSMVS